MIRRESERLQEVKTNLKDGKGNIDFKYIASKEETFNKIKMFSSITIKKGNSIGYHTHVGEEEIMLIKSGKALYKDDGKEYELLPGDVTICFENHYHGIENVQDEDLELVAMIIEK